MNLEPRIAPTLFDALPVGHPRTVAHLLSCVSCREAALNELLPLREPIADAASADRPSSSGGTAPPTFPIATAATSLQASDEPREGLRRLVDTLEQLPLDSLGPAWKAKRYARREVLELVLARSERYLGPDPLRSERLGLLGIALSGRIDNHKHWVPPGIVRAGLLVGSARRLQRKLKLADRAFQQVSVFLEDDLEKAVYAREVGLLRWEQGRWCDAAALLTQAAENFAGAGDSPAEAACWALVGLLRRQEGSPAQATRAFTPLLRSLAALDAGAHPALARESGLALALCLAERGEHQQARAWLQGTRALDALGIGTGEVDEAGIAFAWAEGKLADLEDEPDEAERHLALVRSSWMEAGRLGEAALASLDLALAAARRSNFDRAGSLADELAFRFQGHPGLVFAMQALADFEESFPLRPRKGREAVAVAAHFLRQTFRAQGLAIEPPPFP
jgi:tetratricopeptide (TPR) repeat protein